MIPAPITATVAPVLFVSATTIAFPVRAAPDHSALHRYTPQGAPFFFGRTAPDALNLSVV
jgi:hypothetical protein